IFAFTYLAALAGYLLTFARTVTLVDSGELILTSAGLGVAHPPGTPLYTLLGHLFTKLPWGSIAARVSFMSACFAALSAATAALIVVEVRALRRAGQAEEDARRAASKKKRAADALPETSNFSQF